MKITKDRIAMILKKGIIIVSAILFILGMVEMSQFEIGENYVNTELNQEETTEYNPKKVERFLRSLCHIEAGGCTEIRMLSKGRI